MKKLKKIYHCIDCNRKISKTSALYGNCRCKYCSLLLQKNINHPNYIDGRTNQKHFCIDCGKEISRSNWYYGNKRCKSCAHKGKLHLNYKHGKSCKPNYCIDCGKKIHWRSKRCKFHSNQGKNNPNYNGGTTLKIYYCKCGNKISLANKLYGSCLCKKCSSIELSKKFRGKNSHSYIDGRSYENYPEEFNYELKEKIRDRDNHECQNCHMTEEEHIQITGKKLSIHHIDYDKTNCKEENLISLCILCHIKTNFNRTYWTEFYRNNNQYTLS